MSVVLCNSSKLAMLSQHAEQCPSLKTVVTIGAEPAGEEEREKIERSGLKLFSMKDVEVYTLVGNFWQKLSQPMGNNAAASITHFPDIYNYLKLLQSSSSVSAVDRCLERTTKWS